MTVPRRRGLTLAAALAVVAVVSQGLVSPTRGAETPVAPLVAPGAWTVTSSLSTVRSLSTVTTLDGPACRAPNATPPGWCGKVLAAGGRRGEGSVLRSAELYDPATGYWSPTGPMGVARHSHTATLLDGASCQRTGAPAYCGKVLVAGGAGGQDTNTPLASAELYDPATGTWTTIASMPAVRALHTATALDGPRCRSAVPLLPDPAWCGKVLVVGGLDAWPRLGSKGILKTFGLRTSVLYDPAAETAAETWSATRGDLAIGRYAHSLTALDAGPCRSTTLPAPPYCGRVLIAGGSASAGSTRQGNPEAELYDPDVGQWLPTAPMTASRLNHRAVLLDGPACRTAVPAPYCNKVLVAGGVYINSVANPPGGQPTAELYDPLLDVWAPTSPMASSRTLESGFTLTVVDGPECQVSNPPPYCGSVLATGGTDPVVTVSGGAPEVYDPVKGVFLITGRQLTAVAERAVLIDGAMCRNTSSAPPPACGRVLVFGGGGGGEFPQAKAGAFAELFDGSAGIQPPSVVSMDPMGAPSTGGIRVTVSGAGFTGATDVRFGSESSPHFTVESPTRIVATTPAHSPGVVDLTVQGPEGGSAAISDSRFGFYEPSHDWTPVGFRTAQVQKPTITALDEGRALVVGGATAKNEGVDSAEVFDPAPTVQWKQVAHSLATARRVHTATRLASGEVLVVGGTGPQCCPALRSAEIFDPTTRTWRRTGDLNIARGWHTATLLPSGKVLVTGGANGGTYLTSSELYDPAAVDPVTGVQGTWTMEAPMTTGRWLHHAVLLSDGRVLAVGGFVTCCSPTAQSAEVYDPEAPSGSRWAPTGALATVRESHTVTALPDGRVLVAGGCEVSAVCGNTEPAEIYEPAATDPLTGARGAWRTVAGTRSARYGHSATLLDGPGCGPLCGKVLMAGGWNKPSVPLSSAELFDPVTEAWTPAPSLAQARSEHGTVLLTSGQVLAVGGRIDGNPTALRSAELFAPIGPARPPVVSAVEPAAGPSGTRVRIEGTGLARTTVVSFGGAQVQPEQVTEYVVVAISPPQARGTVPVTVTTPVATSVNDSREATDDFAYAAGRWRKVGALSAERYLHTSTLLDGPRCRGASPPGYCGKVLVAGGTTDFQPVTAGGVPATMPHRSAELYDPAEEGGAGSWAPTTTDMSTPRFNHTATLLDGPECHGPELLAPLHCGKVLVAGGEVTAVAVPSAELYDPATGTWIPTAPLTEPRFAHTATLLADGRVLVVGGANVEFGRAGLKSAEIYDPTSGAFTPAPPPFRGRNAHTATLLPDGTVLVAGGLNQLPDFSNEILAHAEIFDPETGWTEVEPLGIGRFAHSATLLEGPACGERCGKVLVVGGVRSMFGSVTTFQRSAELFDPASGAWTPAAIPGAARASHTATPLPDGTLLVAGSDLSIPGHGRPRPIASSELYDPRSGRWSFTDPLAAPRGLHASSLLDGPACQRDAPPAYCGTVLFSAGTTVGSLAVSAGAPLPVKTAEVYTPAPDVSGVAPGTAGNEGGTVVTIDGAGFSGTSAVRFGDEPASAFTVESPSRIRAVTARTAHMGPVEVTVEGPGGTSALQGGNRAAAFLLVGLPGAIPSLAARALSDTAIELSFAAAHNGDGSTPAQDYVIKQSLGTITTETFDTGASTALCGGKCHFEQSALSYTLRVDDLEPGTTYHYAARALSDRGRGPVSAGVSVTTGGTADNLPCPAPPLPAPGSVVYPGRRYSLIGLPGDTVVGSNSPLYGWSDLGAGGAYSVLDASQPVSGGRGYWAWFACPRAVDMSLPAAGDAASASFALGAYHASMVGNPSATSPATVTGHDFAARWDPALNDGAGGYGISGYREPQTLAVGEGIWTFAYVPTTITILADH